jgi:hypothetical protein
MDSISSGQAIPAGQSEVETGNKITKFIDMGRLKLPAKVCRDQAGKLLGKLTSTQQGSYQHPACLKWILELKQMLGNGDGLWTDVADISQLKPKGVGIYIFQCLMIEKADFESRTRRILSELFLAAKMSQ